MKLELVASMTGSSAGDYHGLSVWVFGAREGAGWLFWRFAEGEPPGATLEAITGALEGDGKPRSLVGPLSALDEAAGPDWALFVPGHIHPDHLSWFRERLEQACARMKGPTLRMLRPTWESRLGLR